MKIKSYPKEIVIKEYTWEIKWVRCVPGYDKNILGLCCPDDKIIYIRMGQTPEERLSTFVHEAIHALEFEWEFNLKHGDIYKLEGPLGDLLRINFLNPMGL